MEKENFKLRYYGKALDNNQIDAKDIAGSILALSDLVNDINNLYGKNTRKVELKIIGWHKGSFITDFLLVSNSFGGAVVTLLTQGGMGLKDMLNLIGLTGGAGVIGFIKKLKGEMISKVETKGDNVIITTGNNNKIKVSHNIYKIYQNANVRENLSYLKEPLEKDGVEGLEIQYNNQKDTLINKDNMNYFNDYGVEEVETIEEDEMLIKVISPNFEVGNKWIFRAMGNNFWASIQDEKFNKDLQNHKFAKGDQLKVKLETKKIGNKIIERNVKKVLKHIETPKQIVIE